MSDILLAILSVIYVHISLKLSSKYAKVISDAIDKMYKKEKD